MFETRKHATNQCLSCTCTIRRTTLQAIRQSWNCGWYPENLQSKNCWQMTRNMTSEHTPLWDDCKGKVYRPHPLTPIQYAIVQRTNLLVAFGILIPGGSKLRKSVCKHGLSRLEPGKPWLGIQISQKPICVWFWRSPVDRPQRWWRHATGMENRTIARVASNSDSGCTHHNISWKLTNHCGSKPQFGES